MYTAPPRGGGAPPFGASGGGERLPVHREGPPGRHRVVRRALGAPLVQQDGGAAAERHAAPRDGVPQEVLQEAVAVAHEEERLSPELEGELRQGALHAVALLLGLAAALADDVSRRHDAAALKAVGDGVEVPLDAPVRVEADVHEVQLIARAVHRVHRPVDRPRGRHAAVEGKEEDAALRRGVERVHGAVGRRCRRGAAPQLPPGEEDHRPRAVVGDKLGQEIAPAGAARDDDGVGAEPLRGVADAVPDGDARVGAVLLHEVDLVPDARPPEPVEEPPPQEALRPGRPLLAQGVARERVHL
eukprot:CAMPEP_0177587824 /NCGR_PEP_ID=MMETSP0419_2-20121207/5874_1 /TAXON_ID=582737 /ORGANISM="Tetraselmis sp., Strain GSL018" /LENGTH=300 /DNA_ID=CAMNT_0019077933 /DNA_START=434 /DNA_END=1337 /DNA_ORIENTATION=-